MTWKTQLARINTSLTGEARGFGEPCVLYSQGISEGVLVAAVMSKIPRAIGDTDAWEELPAASVMASELSSAPVPGDILIEDAGPRWIVDAADREDGMWTLTLRRENP